MSEKDAGGRKKYLVISEHDYRTPRKANIHFIAEELSKRGAVRFFSLRYSLLSVWKDDPRIGIDKKANHKEVYGGVECFLWKTVIHPFNTRLPLLRPVENILFQIYQRWPNPVLLEWMKEADVIIFESGTPAVFFETACKINPNSKKIYRASDDLAMINVASYVQQAFNRAAPKMTAMAMASPLFAENMPQTHNLYYVPQGFSLPDPALAEPSPYREGIHAVSVGNAFFDPSFFEIASREFPEITFHIIGAGIPHLPGYGKNIIIYGEMPYSQTLPYIKHARFGIAAYRSNPLLKALTYSSRKLVQYGFFGLPVVCPQAVVGRFKNRFGYEPGDSVSIKAAIQEACSARHECLDHYLNWSEVTDRMLEPEKFSDTKM